ncbi:MAG: choice-of-anchor J domain-containing protein [Lysobacterales bacterium]
MIAKSSILAAAVALALPGFALAQNSARPGFTPDSSSAALNSVFAPNATITEAFDVVGGAPPCPTGWTCTNNSAPLGTTGWFQGNTVVFPAQAGGTGTEYIGANFNNTTGTNTISNWLITPLVQFGTGSELRFWSRVPTPIAYADRLEIRASTTGTNTGGTNVSTGDFSVLLGTINPGLVTATGTCAVPAAAPNAGGYPDAWCEYRLTNADGLPTTGSGHIGFRYFVTSGGPTGANSSFIGIDTFSFVEGVVLVPVTSVPPSGPVALPAFTIGGPASTTTITFNNTNATAATITCIAPAAAEFTAAPLVINVPASGSAATTVSFSSAALGNFTGVLSCTGSGGEVFNYDLSATAGAAPVALPPAVIPSLGEVARWLLVFSVLGLGFVVVRRRV